ncbi:MAG TPA: hypothetical protein G4N91_01660 [Dehalococcoidia bacterium]|nr:hypothetical protein [Dehalococcoidia bacterium]
MSDSQITLNQFFSPEKKLSPEQLSSLESNKKVSSLKEKIWKETKVKGPLVLDLIIKKTAEILDIGILDIMVKAWNKYKILLKYLDKEKYPPGETFLVPLAEHTIKSEHRPSIEILINDQPAGKIEFSISISIMLEGVILKIQDGKIKGITTGTCKGKGAFACENVVLLEKKTASIPLPGSIDLGEGIPIPSPTKQRG